MRPHTFVNDKYFSYANGEVSDEPTGGTRMPPIVYGETDILTISPTRPSRGLLGGVRPAIGGTRSGGFLSGIRSTTDDLLGTKPRFKPKGKYDGFIFIRKNKRLAEYRKLHRNLRDLIERMKASTGKQASIIQAEIVQVQNKIENMDMANQKLVAIGSSEAIPAQVIEAVMVNPNVTDEEVAKVVETAFEEADNPTTGIVSKEVANATTSTTTEAPKEGKKMNILLPLLGVGVVLYFVFRKK